MFANLILAASLAGQTCAVQGTYQQQAIVRPYTSTIRQAYAPSYAAPYVAAQVYTQYVPVAYYDYASIVGEATRGQDRRIEALKAQADIALRLDRIAGSLEGLGAIARAEAQRQPQYAPEAPAPPPRAPAKPTPQSPEPILPPTPKVNPDDGSVPPPPTPGPVGGPGVGGFSAASVSVFDARCQRCHGAAYAAKSGGGYAMYGADGGIRNDFTGAEMLEIVRRISIGGPDGMPRKALPLAPDEKAPIVVDAMAARAVADFLAAAK